jgi:hypothetical protein
VSLNPKKSGALVKRNLQPVGREGPKKPECQVKSTMGTNSELRCSELWITVLPMRKPRLRFVSKTKLSRVGEGNSCKVQAKWRHSLRRLKMRDTPDGARPCPLQMFWMACCWQDRADRWADWRTWCRSGDVGRRSAFCRPAENVAAGATALGLCSRAALEGPRRPENGETLRRRPPRWNAVEGRGCGPFLRGSPARHAPGRRLVTKRDFSVSQQILVGGRPKGRSVGG